MVDTTLAFPSSRYTSVGVGIRMAVEPFGDHNLQSAGVIAACIVRTGLQLKPMSDWRNPCRMATLTGAQ
jgi:hypothetical protein